MAKLIDRTGKVYGKWTVINYVGDKYWHCICDCGTEHYVIGQSLDEGKSRQCERCRWTTNGEKIRTHNASKTSEYNIWSVRKSRGEITYEPWRESFSAWMNGIHSLIGKRPGDNYRLSRIDAKLGFCPGNVEWLPRHKWNRH